VLKYRIYLVGRFQKKFSHVGLIIFYQFNTIQQIGVLMNRFTDLCECAHDLDVYSDSSLASQYAAKHCYAVFRKSKGKIFKVFALRLV
jgi:hypothetical protein